MVIWATNAGGCLFVNLKFRLLGWVFLERSVRTPSGVDFFLLTKTAALRLPYSCFMDSRRSRRLIRCPLNQSVCHGKNIADPASPPIPLLAPSTPYNGQAVALATRHGKERVIARALRWGLGAELLHVRTVDTDALGTFCGTVQRQGDALQACIAKAEAALREGGTELAIASEGSFGPHPHLPFLAAGMECMVFLDQRRGLTIREQLLARRTNFSHRLVAPGAQDGPEPELERWLGQVEFPSHALIVRPQGAVGPVEKGIRRWEDLQPAIRRAAACSREGLALVETDMRAHCNPTRMAAIRALAFRLVRRIASACPVCQAPGWGLVDQNPGLPCGDCGQATELVLAEVWGCGLCEHREERPRRDGRLVADPGQCQWCNP